VIVNGGIRTCDAALAMLAWCEGVIRYGGAYAHKDSRSSSRPGGPGKFKLYLSKDFRRLKDEEKRRLSLEWDLHRTLSKLNYRTHSDAVKTNLIPALVSAAQPPALTRSRTEIYCLENGEHFTTCASRSSGQGLRGTSTSIWRGLSTG
jgi:hypothetical protein